MRRYAGWVIAAMLAVVPATATAAYLPTHVPDLRALLLVRFFGAVPHAVSPFTVTPASLARDSALRQAAFVVTIDTLAREAPVAVNVPVPRVVARMAPVALHIVAGIAPPEAVAPSLARLPAFPTTAVTSSYQAQTPSFLSGDARAGAFSFTASHSSTLPAFVTQSALDGSSVGTPTLDENVQLPVTLRVGNVHVIAGFDAGLATTASGIDDTLPVFIPSYAQVSRSSLGAHLAFPIAPRLLFGLGYNTERLVTGYGMPSSVEGLDARNDTYSGNLTFLLPRLSSSLSLSAQQYRYQDNLIQPEFTQLRENLDLTVKF